MVVGGMSVTVEYLGSGLTICRSMPASKVRGPLHVHSVTIVGSCATAATRSATGQTLPVAALAGEDGGALGRGLRPAALDDPVMSFSTYLKPPRRTLR